MATIHSKNHFKGQERHITNTFGEMKPDSKSKILIDHNHMFYWRIKIFYALHKPLHWYKLYHFIVLCLIYYSIFGLNIIDEQLANESDVFNTDVTYLKEVVDTIIISQSSFICRLIENSINFSFKQLFCSLNCF